MPSLSELLTRYVSRDWQAMLVAVQCTQNDPLTSVLDHAQLKRINVTDELATTIKESVTLLRNRCFSYHGFRMSDDQYLVLWSKRDMTHLAQKLGIDACDVPRNVAKIVGKARGKDIKYDYLTWAGLLELNNMITEGRYRLNGDCCAACGQLASDGIKLKTCSLCVSTRYCSKTCQREDYPEHRPRCEKIVRAEKLGIYVPGKGSSCKTIIFRKPDIFEGVVTEETLALLQEVIDSTVE